MKAYGYFYSVNIFILDRQPDIAAQYYNDFHVRKIILESVEMMGYAYTPGTFSPLPNLHEHRRHFNHPMSLFVRRSKQNFDWTLQHAQALCREFTFRNKIGKIHAYQSKIDWIAANLPLENLSNSGLTDWPRCFGQVKETVGETNDIVYDYRRYYVIGKRHLAKWTKRETPFWWH